MIYIIYDLQFMIDGNHICHKKMKTKHNAIKWNCKMIIYIEIIRFVHKTISLSFGLSKSRTYMYDKKEIS